MGDWKSTEIAASVAIALATIIIPAHADPDDHGQRDERDEAREAVEAGKAAPLREILAVINRKYPGEVIDVQLSKSEGKLVYGVKLLSRDGRMLTIFIDAGDKRIVGAGGP